MAAVSSVLCVCRLSCQRRSQSYRTYEEQHSPKNPNDDQASDSDILHPDSALNEVNAANKVDAAKGTVRKCFATFIVRHSNEA